ncbi:PSD1 and planctomycete cytochrome C domain-containing protein [Armatimonas sp.]|uniref:PSD1 and planctomycete cytochrome C domain-containing protein n=1 Tax=Armatimonas sp. TaxID=1872638 RepID=UPI0037519A0D
MTNTARIEAFLALGLLLFLAPPARAQLFEAKIRPLLLKRCTPCHGAEKQQGGLRLDSKTGWQASGVVVPGKPEKSRLIERIKSKTAPMPPTGLLPASEQAALEAWVKLGAPDPRVAPKITAASPALGPKLRSRDFVISEADRKWWAFQPVKSPTAPTSIDKLLLAKLTPKGLALSPPATPREQVRRLYFDLWGLPPSPEEVATFERTPTAAAWAQLTDKLLASPHYGERWGRHWLDLVRYGETNGYERDSDKPHAWRYRDYVIDAFNVDKPYDRFIKEQLAGDELEGSGDAGIIATGFFRLHVWDDEPDSTLVAEFDDLDDVMVTTGAAFLGLTIGCARCHDHKYDPVSQRDYYSLLSFLRGVDPYGQHKTGGGGRGTGKITRPLANPTEQALAVNENGPKAKPTFILARGEVGSPRDEVMPAFPEVLGLPAPTLPTLLDNAPTTGRRMLLANWIASDKNPLTARVLANRLWQHHFGRGIVPTPDDFGQVGLRPTNLPLLDYLASELVSGGWKLKRLHKLIVASRAYRMSSRTANPKALNVDQDNTLLWRQNLRRIEAEAVRDTLLSISGQLNFKQGGPSAYPSLPPEVRDSGNPANAGWKDSPEAEQNRRSVYLVVKRALKVPLLDALDFANSTSPAGVRSITTTAPQALMLLNDAFVQKQAEALVTRLETEGGTDKLTRAFALTLQRTPRPTERAAAEHLLSATPDRADWIGLCRALLNLNEVIYVD